MTATDDLRELIALLADMMLAVPYGPAETQARAAAGRLEDYAWLRYSDETAEQAAARVGLRSRTAAWAYEARLREMKRREAA